MLDRAILLYGKSLADPQRILGADHPDVIKSQDHLNGHEGSFEARCEHMTCTRSGLLASTRPGGLGRRLFLVGNDVDVDTGGTCLMDNPPQDRPTVGEMPPATLD
jgi:hypothetical protein